MFLRKTKKLELNNCSTLFNNFEDEKESTSFTCEIFQCWVLDSISFDYATEKEKEKVWSKTLQGLSWIIQKSKNDQKMLFYQVSYFGNCSKPCDPRAGTSVMCIHMKVQRENDLEIFSQTLFLSLSRTVKGCQPTELLIEALYKPKGDVHTLPWTLPAQSRA